MKKRGLGNEVGVYMIRKEIGNRNACLIFFSFFVGIEFGTSLAAVRRRAREYGKGIRAF